MICRSSLRQLSTTRVGTIFSDGTLVWLRFLAGKYECFQGSKMN